MSEISANLLTDKDGGGGSALMKYPVRGSAKAWFNMNGTGTIALRNSLNIASLVDNGTGNYRANYISVFSGRYSPVVNAGTPGSASGNARGEDSQPNYLICYTFEPTWTTLTDHAVILGNIQGDLA